MYIHKNARSRPMINDDAYDTRRRAGAVVRKLNI